MTCTSIHFQKECIMKFDYISYWSAKPYVDLLDLKKTLPTSIQEGLLKGDKFQYGINVETSFTDIVREIDRVFQIGKTRDIVKFRHVEIDNDEIPNYMYYRIAPKGLEHNKQVLFDLSRPKCHSEVCPWGSGITSPITIKQKALKKLGIAQIRRLWSDRPELILSSELKGLFDSVGITGLEYEACVNETDKVSGSSEKPDAYFARITPVTYQLADDIILKTHCRKHNIILNYDVFNLRTPEGALLHSDFQVITELKIGRETYTYYMGQWIISRKVLELLLKNKIPGLGPIGYVLGRKYIPIIIE
jgi:hypothetical protein